ncbi:6668_t:CDS:1, partial [Acaulospora morrowiae]
HEKTQRVLSHMRWLTSETGMRLYDVSKYFPDNTDSTTASAKRNYMYVRISSLKQRP